LIWLDQKDKAKLKQKVSGLKKLQKSICRFQRLEMLSQLWLMANQAIFLTVIQN
jgi:cell fate (sporulation/competence/biofilm development) regulator YmcA (YheA/YmcA/DUF963 family)